MLIDLTATPDKPDIKAFELTPKPPKPEILAPLDEFSVSYQPKKYELMTGCDLWALSKGTAYVDVESFINYFLIGFKINGKYVQFERTINTDFNHDALKFVLERFELIGFYSNSYDMLMIRLALFGIPCDELKDVSNAITSADFMDRNAINRITREYNLPSAFYNHIDLVEVCPLTGSLKMYAMRLHCQRMQSLPYPHHACLDVEQMEQVRQYNTNDLDNTETLAIELTAPLDLRRAMSKTYKIDLRSKSDAQIAEAVISKELERITHNKPQRPEQKYSHCRYRKPQWLNFNAPVFQELLKSIEQARFVIEDNGYVTIPDSLEGVAVPYGNCVYRIGIGGLHSSEQNISHKNTDNIFLMDCDVVSYYPAITLNEQNYPRHLGRQFLLIYNEIVQKRISAKAAGDKTTASSLKITINGSFGKFGSKWSILYSPDLMLQCTVGGQLALLKLIEMLEQCQPGCVVSANTDGVLIKAPVAARSALLGVVHAWEDLSGFKTEQGEYRSVHSRDVNNYVAIDLEGKAKVKGTYSERGSSGDTILSKNPENQICNDAVIAYLAKGTPVEQTVNACKDIRRFLTVRAVTGGAIKVTKSHLEDNNKTAVDEFVELGKVIRWYYSTEMVGHIARLKPNDNGNHNKVPNTDQARPLMELPSSFPNDVDLARYIALCHSMLRDLAVTESQTPRIHS